MSRIIGLVDNLGYLYCTSCKPEALSMGVTHVYHYPVPVFDDSDDGTDPCEMCHKPIGKAAYAAALA